MNILLTTINSKYIHQNLAIRILYEMNKNHNGLQVEEFGLKSNINEIVNFCSKYELVAFSCYIWNIERTIEVADKIKKANPSCKIMLGGPEVSYEWEEIIALSSVDFIILGEGEIPFSKFLELFPAIDLVPGLVWKKDGKIIQNHAPEIFDVQQLNSINPYKSLTPEELVHKICYIEASRGCPGCCEFCLAGREGKVRHLPEKTVQANLLYLMENGKVIKFLDRTFNAKPAFAISIFQFILEHYKPGNIFQFEIKADVLQDELIAFIQKNVPKGIFRFEIGIQTLNAKSNREVKRKQNFENIKTFISRVADRVEIHLDLIVGLPHDYFSDIKYSFEEVFKLFAPELQLGFLKFLKGTPLRESYKEHAYNFDPLPPYQIIESKYLSRAEIDNIVWVEHALDLYWNKKRAVNTLKYVASKVSIFDFLSGLGKSWKNEPGKVGLTEVYNVLHDFSKHHYPDDTILLELIAFDYYMQHKIRPAIRFLPEISNKERNDTVERRKLNHHKFRYVIHTVHFSVQKLINDGVVELSNEQLIIEYSGVDKARVIVHEL